MRTLINSHPWAFNAHTKRKLIFQLQNKVRTLGKKLEAPCPWIPNKRFMETGGVELGTKTYYNEC